MRLNEALVLREQGQYMVRKKWIDSGSDIKFKCPYEIKTYNDLLHYNISLSDESIFADDWEIKYL